MYCLCNHEYPKRGSRVSLADAEGRRKSNAVQGLGEPTGPPCDSTNSLCSIGPWHTDAEASLTSRMPDLVGAASSSSVLAPTLPVRNFGHSTWQSCTIVKP